MIEIVESERAKLAALARSQIAPHRLVVRAKAMEMVLCGTSNKEIGASLGISERTVCKWRRRFATSPGLESLQDAKRSGRPVQIKLETPLELAKLACEQPDKKKVQNPPKIPTQNPDPKSRPKIPTQNPDPG